MLQPCIECGELSMENRCEEHRPQRPPKRSFRKRGYDSRWDRLSKKARKLQPFCGICGNTADLTLDHTPETWERYEQGLPVGLQHTGGVLCRSHNAKKGAARPGEIPQPGSTACPPVKAFLPSHTPGGYMGGGG